MSQYERGVNVFNTPEDIYIYGDRVAKAEREDILKLLRMHASETWEERNEHEDGCTLCQDFYGLDVAIQIIERLNNE